MECSFKVYVGVWIRNTRTIVNICESGWNIEAAEKSRKRASKPENLVRELERDRVVTKKFKNVIRNEVKINFIKNVIASTLD